MKKLEFNAAYYFGPKKIKILKKNKILDNNVHLIIKVESCTICGSDLRIFNEGSKRITEPRIIGHETSGTVFFSKSKKYKFGDKVSLGADFEKKQDFAFGYEINGGFSQFIFLSKKEMNLAPISKFYGKTSFDEAALAEPLACCINGFEKMKFKKNKVVVIFGSGPIGLMIGLLADRFNSKKIFFVDLNKKRLKFAQKIINCETLIMNKKKLIKNFFKLNNDSGADYIFTANPSIESHKLALSIANKGCVINLFGGVSKKASKINIDSNFIHYNEINLMGSHGSSHLQHKKALNMIDKKKINLKPLISHKIKLKNLIKGYNILLKGDGIKVAIKPNI
tara:strand:- start:775 stop:1785 length:1011 start_codon:yes stop_codon:yes gene_type:complete